MCCFSSDFTNLYPRDLSMKKEYSSGNIAIKKENLHNEAQDINDRSFDQTTANRSHHGHSHTSSHQVMLQSSCDLPYLSFWPTVLSVMPLARCVVCHLSSVCNVLYCGETVRPSKKVSEGVNRKPGSKSSFFGLPPYFYFRFRRYDHRDCPFCL